jgi:hypothetical protein
VQFLPAGQHIGLVAEPYRSVVQKTGREAFSLITLRKFKDPGPFSKNHVMEVI